MNSDATEAALGLLGLSPLNAPQSHPQPEPHPHHHVAHTHGPSLTSSNVGIAVDRTTALPLVQSALPPSLVPLKRKQPSPALSSPTATPLTPTFLRDGLSTKPRQFPHPLATSSSPPAYPTPTMSLTAPFPRRPQRPCSPTLSTFIPPQTPPQSLVSPSVSHHPLSLTDVPPPPDTDAISCICGFTYDDGFSIACDDCSRWCHAACFGIVQGGEVPEVWKCWVCDPTLEVDKDRAVKIQKGRVKAIRTKPSQGTNVASGAASVNGAATAAGEEGSSGVGKPASRRRASPGAERKSRRGSAVAAAIEGSSSRKKRRASMLSPTNTSSPSIPPANHTSTQPSASGSRSNGATTSSNQPPAPVTFPPDVYPNPSVHAQLLRVAKAWRGVTALNPPSPLLFPPPRTYSDGGYTRVHSQGYRDRYGYSMSPLDSTTPVIMDQDVGDVYVPRTVLRTDPSTSCPSDQSGSHSQNLPSLTSCTPAHLRPPSPRLHVASDPSPFSHTSVYPSPPISNFISTPVPNYSHPYPYTKSPLTPSTNIVPSSNPTDKIPATTLLAPYTAAIVPSAAYLADPLNGYAHLGMGKPQVRLVGGGWDVGLDARAVGGSPDPVESSEKTNDVGATKVHVEEGKAKWARCGCWPNAVVRPVICSEKNARKKRKAMRHKAGCAVAASDGGAVPDGSSSPSINGRSAAFGVQGQQLDDSSDQDDGHSASDSDTDATSLSFALFALRDLRADEEIVLGWEWDDGHAVHMLPALMESPGLFAPAHLHHLRAQFTSILHALSSTFTICACGSSTRDCAVRLMEQVVEGRWPWPGGEMASEGSEDDSSDVNGTSEEWDDIEEEIDVEGDGNADMRQNRNRGLGMNVDIDMDATIEVGGRTRQVKKRKVRRRSKVVDPTSVNGDKDVSDVASSSTLKPKAKKAIDLGPLVGAKRGFRTREKAPLNGGWGGVEIVPSSMRTFPQVSAEDPPVGGKDKGKGKGRMADGEDGADVDFPLPALPPRMRRRQRLHPPENPPQNHSIHAGSWTGHDRWRSPPDTNAESPISISGLVEGSGGRGKTDTRKQVSVNGDGEDGQETEFDTETEGDGSDDTRQMPPPPMPASLDPTTVSSLAHAVRSGSPRGSVQWNKNGIPSTWIPPQTTQTSASPRRPSQPTNPGVLSATQGPPNMSGARSVSSQANHSPLSPSTLSQSALQVHSSPLASSVSPSATFSKLSLHSPDAPSSPHPSVSSIPNEYTSLSSSPPHRPSKPLHVHLQNETPSLPTSISAPVVTLSASDYTRDTPAEAQHQQSYRSSPEARSEHPVSDAERKRSTNGEGYRVRFASPEILSGMPRLGGRAPLHSLEPSAVLDATPDNASALEAAKASPSDNDAMTVDSGDNQRSNSNDPLHPVSHEDDVPQDKRSSPPVPGSSRPQAPPDPHSTFHAEVGNTLENIPSPTASSVKEVPSQGEPMIVDTESVQHPREPSPPPPPKVKMSLKDFALRKKKQREEEMAAKAFDSPVTPDGPALPSSPSADVKQGLASESAAVVQSTEAAVFDVKMKDTAQGDVADVPAAAHATLNGLNGSSPHGCDAVCDPRRTEEKVTAKDNKVAVDAQAPSTTVADPDTLQPSPPQDAHSLSNSSHVASERNETDDARAQVDNIKPPMTLIAKVEIMDEPLPTGLVSADDPTPDVVSLAPEPPPPPLTTKQTSEAVDDGDPIGSIPRSAQPLIPTPASTPTSMSTSTSTSAVNSRANSVGISSTPNPTSNTLLHAHFTSASSSIPSSRRPSHEDGEISSATPPKSYLPRSHTPPTQPRSFHAIHPSSPNLGPTSSSTTPIPRRPTLPSSRSPLSNNGAPPPLPAMSSRPLPSGPRALRGSMGQPTQPYPPVRPPYSGSQYIPRGPSADRDRIDWDRGDRQWAPQVRPRGRAGSNGWGR